MFFYIHIISNPNPFLTKQLTVNCENEHNKTTTTEYKSKQEMLVLSFNFRSMNKDLNHSTTIIVKCLSKIKAIVSWSNLCFCLS